MQPILAENMIVRLADRKRFGVDRLMAFGRTIRTVKSLVEQTGLIRVKEKRRKRLRP